MRWRFILVQVKLNLLDRPFSSSLATGTLGHPWPANQPKFKGG